jgi:hypothetical protein
MQKVLLIVLFLMFVLLHSTPSKAQNTTIFYLAENGITIKCPQATVGQKGMVNGIEYEAVNRTLLNQRRNEGADLTRVCTSLVTDLN